eukprot:m.257096 g.257096  ORF g.257096 m.257096 type:complete len:76 (+) comp23548_c0_seq1:116-343(+)
MALQSLGNPPDNYVYRQSNKNILSNKSPRGDQSQNALAGIYCKLQKLDEFWLMDRRVGAASDELVTDVTNVGCSR